MKIAVLMSTYNGEKYICQQINSILNQKLHESNELKLYIRDDGSSDKTINILKDYAYSRSEVIFINQEHQKNLGAKESFLSLLKLVYETDSEIEYFAFSDQDDVWFSDKLSSGISQISKSHSNKGALYYTNKCIVDNNLNIIKNEHIQYYDDFIETLWSSLAFGCTMIFNRKLVSYVIQYDSQYESYHDAWVYRLAKCIGSDIYFDETAHIYYRQHKRNIVGKDACKPHNNISYMIKHFLTNIVKPRAHLHQNQIKEIVQHYPDSLDASILPYADAVVEYTSKVKEKIFLLTAPEMKKRPLITRLTWIYKVVFNII